MAYLYLPHLTGAILTLLFGLLLVHFGTRAFGRLLTRSPHFDIGNDRFDGGHHFQVGGPQLMAPHDAAIDLVR